MFVQINALEKDLLREIFNIGVSKAADALSMLMKNRKSIMLTVPEVNIISPEDLPVDLSHLKESVLVVRSRLEGDISGITLLLFYEDQIEWIVGNCLSDKELMHEETTILRMSLLLEMSNILTGAVLTQLSNILNLKVRGMPPVAITSEKNASIEDLICELPPCQPIVLSVKTDFLDQQRVIELPLLIVLEISSLSAMLNTIRQKGLHDHKFLEKNF